MSQQKNNPTKNGFTIIEVLIVLAMAGLILSVVLLAIPALMRNSRNNQRKQDVSNVLDAVSSYALNNSGRLPDAASNPSDATFLDTQRVKLAFYEPNLSFGTLPGGGGGIAIIPQVSGSGGGESNADLNTAVIYNYRKCDAANPGAATTVGAGYRDIVAVYGIETGGAVGASKCLQL